MASGTGETMAWTPPAPALPPGPGPNENCYTLIYGMKGMGKTTLARMILRARAKRGGSWVFVDRTGANGDLGVVATTLREVVELIQEAVRARRPFGVVVQLGWGQSHEPLWEFLYQVGDLLLVLDEAEAFASTSRIDKNLEQLVNLGRNKRVDILSTVRTPPELSPRLSGNWDVAITFRQPLPDYAEVLNRRFFRLSSSERILSLPRFHYLRAKDGKVTLGAVNI